MPSATSPLPTHMGVVMAKVLRLENDKCIKRRTRLRRKLDIEYCDSGKLAPAPTQANKSDLLKSKKESRQQAPAPKSRESAQLPPKVATPSPPPVSSSPAPAPVAKPPVAAPAAPVAPAPTPSPPPPPPEPVLNREELAAKREALVQEQVDAALIEKREVFLQICLLETLFVCHSVTRQERKKKLSWRKPKLNLRKD